MGHDLTIVVPTHNRHHLLDRTLPFFLDFKCPVLILDSGDTMHPSASEQPMVEYVFCKGMGLGDKLKKYILERVRTPFMMMNADDIFPVKTNVFNSLDFLKKNPDFSSAQGASYYNKGGVFTKYREDYELYQADSDHAGTRFMEHFLCEAHNFYGVTRTDCWQEIWKNTPGFTYPQLQEIYQILMTLLCGKAKRSSDIFHIVDDVESSPWDVPTRGFHWDSITFTNEYENIRKIISKQLQQREGLPERCGARYVDSAIAVYLSMYRSVVAPPVKLKRWHLNKPDSDLRCKERAKLFEKIKQEFGRLMNKTLHKQQKKQSKLAEREAIRKNGDRLLSQALQCEDANIQAELRAIVSVVFSDFKPE